MENWNKYGSVICSNGAVMLNTSFSSFLAQENATESHKLSGVHYEQHAVLKAGIQGTQYLLLPCIADTAQSMSLNCREEASSKSRM